MKKRRKILIFTGAGISAESGIKTFRDSKDGLWENFPIKEVASIEGWNKNPKVVLDFYNNRRKECLKAEPNKAHFICSELEKDFDVCVVTQNVDPLHTKAGSKDVIHLHGELIKSRSVADRSLVYDCTGDINIGDVCEKGAQLRPNIVWFGEELDNGAIELAKEEAEQADVCIVVGTSMQVYPAAHIPFLTKETCIIYYVDPGDVQFSIPNYRKAFFYHIKKNATDGMEEVKNDLNEIFG